MQATPPQTLTDIQRAARFLYLQKLAFGGKVDGQSFGTATTRRPRFNIFTLEQDLADAHYRLAQTTIEYLDWKEVIRRYDRPHTLFYCDPHYWKTEGYTDSAGSSISAWLTLPAATRPFDALDQRSPRHSRLVQASGMPRG